MVTVKGMNIVLMRMKYRAFLPLNLKYTREYAANTLVMILNSVTDEAMKNVFVVILIKGILISTLL